MIVPTLLTAKMLVPDVGAVAREMTSGSQIEMILRRVRKLSPATFVQVGINNLKYLPLLAKKDFATGIKLLSELEILASPVKRSSWVLHNQMTDMAIALGNTNLLLFFFVLAETYDFKPAIFTYNPERCIQFLSSMHGLPKHLVIFCPQTSPAFQQFAQTTHLQISFIEGKI